MMISCLRMAPEQECSVALDLLEPWLASGSHQCKLASRQDGAAQQVTDSATLPHGVVVEGVEDTQSSNNWQQRIRLTAQETQPLAGQTEEHEDAVLTIPLEDAISKTAANIISSMTELVRRKGLLDRARTSCLQCCTLSVWGCACSCMH
jgi:hypothetical protein